MGGLILGVILQYMISASFFKAVSTSDKELR